MAVHKIFLSPHFDDVALSCGGTVAMFAGRGERVLVVTVCGALPPPQARSPLIDKVHTVRGFTDGAAYVCARREEDRAAASILGAEVEWGSSLDAIYREPAHYSRSATLLGQPAAGDPLFAETCRLIADLNVRLPNATLYAPLAIRGHVDHRLVSAAARTAGGQVWFYEEFPNGVVRDPRMWPGNPQVIDIGPYVERRIAAVLCYRSQISPLFGDEANARAALLAHVGSVGGERLWRR
jgi:LmbE family N-acetylglucosaminyl deacetylase